MSIRRSPGMTYWRRHAAARSVSRAAIAPVFALLLTTPALSQAGDTTQPTGRWQDASIEDYRKHLLALRDLTQACAQARNVKTCDPTLVGPDDRIPISAGQDAPRRMVRYGWLRVLLYRADEPDKPEAAQTTARHADHTDRSPRAAPRTVSQLLRDAQTRLIRDLAQAGQPIPREATHSAERDLLKDVLAGREFRNLQQAPANDTVLERIGNWLNRMFTGFTRLRARSAWVGRALVWAFFLAVGALLAWRLLRMERRGKKRFVSPARTISSQAASARDWELWLADARAAAAEGRWRDAIHYVYWASISRLESKRLWPADRARTPREYLALMPPEDPRTPSLTSLTRSFERIWYGGREAGEPEFRHAEQIAATLTGAAEGGPS